MRSDYARGPVRGKAVPVALALEVAVARVGSMQCGVYRDNTVIDAATPPVKKTLLRVANTPNRMPLANATYQGLFTQVDANVSKIGKKLLEVQTAATARTAP